MGIVRGRKEQCVERTRNKRIELIRHQPRPLLVQLLRNLDHPSPLIIARILLHILRFRPPPLRKVVQFESYAKSFLQQQAMELSKLVGAVHRPKWGCERLEVELCGVGVSFVGMEEKRSVPLHQGHSRTAR